MFSDNKYVEICRVSKDHLCNEDIMKVSIQEIKLSMLDRQNEENEILVENSLLSLEQLNFITEFLNMVLK